MLPYPSALKVLPEEKAILKYSSPPYHKKDVVTLSHTWAGRAHSARFVIPITIIGVILRCGVSCTDAVCVAKKCKCFSECFCALIWNYLLVDGVQKGLFPHTHARSRRRLQTNVISHTTVPYTFPLFLSLGADGRRESDLRLCRGKLIGRFLLIRRQQFQIAEQHLFRCVRCTTGREKRATVKPNRVQFTRFFCLLLSWQSKRNSRVQERRVNFLSVVQRESHFVTEVKLFSEEVF